MNHRGTDQLRRGRVSIPHARYFITVCTVGRIKGLNQKAVSEYILNRLREMHAAQDLYLLCATIMPDHIHMIYRLCERLSLGRVQAKFKSKTRAALFSAGLEWQGNFFDHRLRENLPAERFVRYIYLNPYAKGLIPRTESWPHWALNKEYRPELLNQLEGGVAPPVEWLGQYQGASQLIDEDMKQVES